MSEPLNSMQELQATLQQTAARIRKAARALRGDLDAEQLPLYDLAFSAAEVEAAMALTARAEQAGRDTDFLRALATVFAAEVELNVHSRLIERPATYGLTAADLPTPELSGALDPDRLAELGRAALARRDAEPDDGLDSEKRMIRANFQQFADTVVAPMAEDIHRNDADIPEEILQPLREMGCFGLSVPERFGGLKPDGREDSIAMVVVTQALSSASLGAAGSLITRPEIMARAILEGGTDAQKSRWLPALAAGQPLCAVSVTEPNTGSDVASVALKAERVDGGWKLNGAKTWCTFAGQAEAVLVLARTDANALPPHTGLSLFIVEKPRDQGHAFDHQQPGGGRLTGRAIPTLGYRGMHSFEMSYQDFFVPAENLIGEEGGVGRGFYYTMRGFMGGRLQTAARACGLMQAATHAAMGYGQERSIFSKPLSEFPLTLAKYARMTAYLYACQQQTYAVAQLMDSGVGALEASMVKLLACRYAEWVTREAVQIFGGMGYAEESAVSRYFVDARVLSIFEGAEETLAIRVVGKGLVAQAKHIETA